jgi:hypothetical protein
LPDYEEPREIIIKVGYAINSFRECNQYWTCWTMEDRFPAIWMPSTDQRDLRTLLRDRHQWVKIRSRLQHTLQAIALNQALRQGRGLSLVFTSKLNAP